MDASLANNSDHDKTSGDLREPAPHPPPHPFRRTCFSDFSWWNLVSSAIGRTTSNSVPTDNRGAHGRRARRVGVSTLALTQALMENLPAV
jgi:hypothetical protein